MWNLQLRMRAHLTLEYECTFITVEFVMALVGATMGASLTYILPSYIYLKVAEDQTSKTEAQVIIKYIINH